MKYLRGHFGRQDEGEDGGIADDTPLRFVISTEGVKADGKDLPMGDWDFSRYERHPVVLWVHDFMGRNLPLGTAKVTAEKKRLLGDVTFDVNDPFAMAVRAKVLTDPPQIASSVSWDEVEGKNQLLDVSMVPVPVDPEALPVRQARAWQEVSEMMHDLLEGVDGQGSDNKRTPGAIAPHTTPKDDEAAAWDAGAELRKVEDGNRSKLRQMHGWVDDEADPDTKRAYKLPHHRGDSPNVVWRGVAAAMSRLMQTGTQIPDGQRRGVYNHLSRHYRQFDREPPEFRSIAELSGLFLEEIRGLFLEGEPEIFPELFADSDERSGEGEGDGEGTVRAPEDVRDLEEAILLLHGILERAKEPEQEFVPEEDTSNLLRQWRDNLEGVEIVQEKQEESS